MKKSLFKVVSPSHMPSVLIPCGPVSLKKQEEIVNDPSDTTPSNSNVLLGGNIPVPEDSNQQGEVSSP